MPPPRTRRSAERSSTEDSPFSALANSSVAGALLHLPDGKILQLSKGARRLLHLPHEVHERFVSDVVVDDPSDALDLVYDGKLRSFESVFVVKTPRGEVPVRAWAHRLSEAAPPELAVAVFEPVQVDTPGRLPLLTDRDVPTVLGAVDEELRVEGVSAEVQTAFGYQPEALVGQSLLKLIAPSGIGTFIWALAEATAHQHGTAIRVPVLQANGESAWRCMVIVPLVPAPSLAFALLGDCPGGDDATAADRVVAHLARGILAARTAHAARAMTPNSPMPPLSPRELEVAYRLSSGDRVPAIAEAMFVSQSTVRNYLSSIFRKLGLKSQQDLIDYMRRAGPSLRREESRLSTPGA